MDRIALSLIAVLLIGFAVLLVTPQDQKSASTQTQYFINLYAGNVTVVQDAEFARDRIQLTDTLVGGLQITLSRSHALELEQYTVSEDDLAHTISTSVIETSVDNR